MRSYKELFSLVDTHIRSLDFAKEPRELYDPIGYMLSLGGKRLRPVLVLMAHELFSSRVEQALPAATAIELFHNFTLVHDDIMDHAAIRRGMPTVHEKWNQPVAILSGDLMMVKATEQLCNSEPALLKPLLDVFNQTAAEVCEGQQIDMNFESRGEVSESAYLHMITLKTAVLLGCALKMGAIIAGASEADAAHMYAFGKNIGVAFQVQDDLLDAFGEAAKVGKKIGGDIVANKKTLLLIEAQKKADAATAKDLDHWLSVNDREDEKIAAVLAIYKKLGAREEAEKLKQHYLQVAFDELEKVQAPAGDKSALKDTALDLMQRMS